MNKTWWLRSRPTNIEISVVTDPIPCGSYRLTEGLKSRLRTARNAGRSLFGRGGPHVSSPFRGHSAVTRSLVQGLAKLNVAHTYNPQNLNDLSQTVIVLSGVRALR